MLALRLTRVAHPAVQLRRLTVVAASTGTGFLLLCSLGHALGHPADPSAALLRLAWCAVPLAATAYLAVAVARSDPGTRPRGGLSALGLGPARLMAVSAATTALSCAFGALLALLLFLWLRGDLPGPPFPFDGAPHTVLAARKRLPVPGTLLLLATVPAVASAAVAAALRPREPKTPPARAAGTARGTADDDREPHADGNGTAGGSGTAEGNRTAGGSEAVDGRPAAAPVADDDPGRPLPPDRSPTGLPWGIAVLAAGLTVETYAGGTGDAARTVLPGGLTAGSAPVLAGWLLTAVGLALAGPGLTHLCGRLLQAVRPGAVRLLAGRVLMAEAGRIGSPLGVLCAVASAAFAMIALHGRASGRFGPLTALGALLVAGCAVAALVTAAVEARQLRGGTTAALRRLGAPATVLRSAAALRSAALLALFAPLTWAIATLAALPLTR
ncbi:hypothetical protein AB0P32_15925 [Streptomyces sp. NPDC085995]|uniref:hypothetical protein n=1 Tax=Streptomyces sp. NPDC085995 TaxID=3154861 RepID=UPI00344910D6